MPFLFYLQSSLFFTPLYFSVLLIFHLNFIFMLKIKNGDYHYMKKIINPKKIFCYLICLLMTFSLTAKAPKYVFLFIGDGMSFPQFQTTADYLGAIADKDAEQALPSKTNYERKGAVLDGPKKLNFMNFEAVGSACNYDSCSFAPDSASTATSIASGKKTYSGMLNLDETGKIAYETIAEKLHKQKEER